VFLKGISTLNLPVAYQGCCQAHFEALDCQGMEINLPLLHSNKCNK
jgi:hypothetical protein